MNDPVDRNTASYSSDVDECVRKGFSSASNYEQIRQEYPIEAVEFLLQKLGLHTASTSRADQVTVLELGSGTGKFTRVMLEVLKGKNVRVIASDPLENMCEHFKLLLPDTEIIQCRAEDIKLPDASVDVVIASQSFHWFANSTSLKEIHRVLVPGGRFGMIWSLLDITVPWAAKIWEFVSSLEPEKFLAVPYYKEWKNVFDSTPPRLFGDLEENQSFRDALPSSFNKGYNFLASFSVITSGSESTKESFRELYKQVMKEDFEDKGISFDRIPFQIYMNWCNKLI